MVVEETDTDLTTHMVTTQQDLLLWVVLNLHPIDNLITLTDTNHTVHGAQVETDPCMETVVLEVERVVL